MAVTSTSDCRHESRCKLLPNGDNETDMQESDMFALATMVALETGNLTPLIKEELKYTIQSRRLAEGKGELAVEFTKPTQEELTPEEIKKKEKRREQNRIAARKFRRKQSTAAHDLKKKIQKLESENTKLKSDLRQLSQEKNYLRGKLQAHLYVCGAGTLQDSSNTLTSLPHIIREL